MTMVEYVARTICRAAANGGYCPFCEEHGACTLWPTFAKEARCAIEAVRDYARLDMRRKPRQRTAEDIVSSA